ncbi:MAG: reverse transcriptase/maturase family protein [Actinomycetes bacterium]|jgi:hypothetical protein|nr:reverse transcriptase/maturase family protein [Actinomycetes bacterium]
MTPEQLHEWRNKHSKPKGYAHFDLRVSCDSKWDYITDPEKVARHGFYPFIHYVEHTRKYHKGTGTKAKERPIRYAAHIDRCIYQYYSLLLEEKYVRRIAVDGTADCAIAYRSDLKKCNIDFAKAAFDCIAEHPECFVLIGDFTGFFDHLDHRYLKERLLSLFGAPKLPADYYAVYKNITRYSDWSLKSLLEINGVKTRRELDRKKRVLTPEQYRQLSKRESRSGAIARNDNDYGIPQGSPISGVLSNVYMLEFDKLIHDLVTEYSGKYMRYCDDFIVIIPSDETDGVGFDCIYKRLVGIIDSIPGLDLQPDKTRVYHRVHSAIHNCNEDYLPDTPNTKDVLEYLGFAIDGTEVRIRDKTISKYHYRLRRKINTVNAIAAQDPHKGAKSRRMLYQIYSEKGDRKQPNFLNYVKRSHRTFERSPSLFKGTKRHMKIIKRGLQ